jgi:hypothetical protein
MLPAPFPIVVLRENGIAKDHRGRSAWWVMWARQTEPDERHFVTALRGAPRVASASGASLLSRLTYGLPQAALRDTAPARRHGRGEVASFRLHTNADAARAAVLPLAHDLCRTRHEWQD